MFKTFLLIIVLSMSPIGRAEIEIPTCYPCGR